MTSGAALRRRRRTVIPPRVSHLYNLRPSPAATVSHPEGVTWYKPTFSTVKPGGYQSARLHCPRVRPGQDRERDGRCLWEPSLDLPWGIRTPPRGTSPPPAPSHRPAPRNGRPLCVTHLFTPHKGFAEQLGSSLPFCEPPAKPHVEEDSPLRQLEGTDS